MKARDIRDMDKRERFKLLLELEAELMSERGRNAHGGSESSGHIRRIRRDIARVRTVMNEV